MDIENLKVSKIYLSEKPERVPKNSNNWQALYKIPYISALKIVLVI